MEILVEVAECREKTTSWLLSDVVFSKHGSCDIWCRLLFGEVWLIARSIGIAEKIIADEFSLVVMFLVIIHETNSGLQS